MNSALVIIDMQNYLIDEELYNKDELIINIKSLIKKARKSNIPIFFVRHIIEKNKEDEEELDFNIISDIEPFKEDIIIDKHTPDSFYETNLQKQLEAKSITKIFVAGLQTEYCIDTTCRSAFVRGYDVVLVKNGHSTYDTDTLKAEQIIEHHNTLLNEWFVNLKDSGEINFQ